MDIHRKKIMLVDDNVTNLTVGKNALIKEYDIFTLPSAEKLFMVMQRVRPDLILLDIEMPEMNGYEVMEILQSTPEYANIPVIFLTAMDDNGSEQKGLDLGAVDYITKPFSVPLLKKRIETHLLLSEKLHRVEMLTELLRDAGIDPDQPERMAQ